jgi:[acyl-carrier-protein] S-malonyltransferase
MPVTQARRDQSLSHLLDLPLNPRLALTFPGQGSQRVGMGEDAVSQFASAKAVFDAAGDSLDVDLAELCFHGPEDRLTDTANAQPAILTASLAYLAAALESGSITERPAYMAGHSLGQYTALAAAGSLSIGDAVAIVRTRGELMAHAGSNRPGTMAAVLGLDEATVEQICAESQTEPANYNGPTQVVIGGTRENIAAAAALAKDRGGKVLPVKVAGAFHTSLMTDAAAEFGERLSRVQFAEAVIPVVSNVTGAPVTEPVGIIQDLSAQVTRPVQWNRTIAFMLGEGIDTYVEVGPGKTLTGMLKRIAPEARAVSIDSTKALTAVTGV